MWLSQHFAPLLRSAGKRWSLRWLKLEIPSAPFFLRAISLELYVNWGPPEAAISSQAVTSWLRQSKDGATSREMTWNGKYMQIQICFIEHHRTASLCCHLRCFKDVATRLSGLYIYLWYPVVQRVDSQGLDPPGAAMMDLVPMHLLVWLFEIFTKDTALNTCFARCDFKAVSLEVTCRLVDHWFGILSILRLMPWGPVRSPCQEGDWAGPSTQASACNMCPRQAHLISRLIEQYHAYALYFRLD